MARFEIAIKSDNPLVKELTREYARGLARALDGEGAYQYSVVVFPIDEQGIPGDALAGWGK